MPGEDRPRLVARGRARDAADGRRTNASAGSVTRVSGSGSGSVGKSSVRSVRRWKVAGAADQLDVLLGAAQLHRQLLGGQRAGDIEQQPRRQHGGAGARRPRRRAERAGRSPCRWRSSSRRAVGLGGDHHAGQRLHGAARRRDACRASAVASEARQRRGTSFMYCHREISEVHSGCGYVRSRAMHARICGRRLVDRLWMTRGSLSGSAVGRGRHGVARRLAAESCAQLCRRGWRRPRVDALRRRAGRRAARWCDRARRTPGRSRAATAPVSSRERYMATWRGQATRGGAGAREELLGGEAELLAGRRLDLGDRCAARGPARAPVGRGRRGPRRPARG